MKRNRFLYMWFSLVAALLVVLAIAPATAQEALNQQLLVDKARIIVGRFVADPNMIWLRTHLKDAKGGLIVPEFIKGAFVVGGA